MSTSVRLIGGDCDGEVVKVDEDQLEFFVSNRKPLLCARAGRGALGITPTDFQLQHSRYTRRSVSTPGGVVEFFAFEALSDFGALQHVLGP